MDTSTFSLLQSQGISGGFGDVDLVDIEFIDNKIHWKLINKMPFSVVIDKDVKFVEQGKTGKKINSNQPFKVGENLPTPLQGKREDYNDLTDTFTDNMQFLTYHNNGNEKL
jgi:hemerythrin superfamily protein